MSNEYMTLVLAKHTGNDKVYLFMAPTGAYFEDGQRIIVETKLGNSGAVVVGSDSYNTIDSKITQMLIAATGATLPLKKVVGKVVPIEWPEDEEEKENSDGE